MRLFLQVLTLFALKIAVQVIDLICSADPSHDVTGVLA